MTHSARPRLDDSLDGVGTRPLACARVRARKSGLGYRSRAARQYQEIARSIHHDEYEQALALARELGPRLDPRSVGERRRLARATWAGRFGSAQSEVHARRAASRGPRAGPCASLRGEWGWDDRRGDSSSRDSFLWRHTGARPLSAWVRTWCAGYKMLAFLHRGV
jgi:hypothetical protein